MKIQERKVFEELAEAATGQVLAWEVTDFLQVIKANALDPHGDLTDALRIIKREVVYATETTEQHHAVNALEFTLEKVIYSAYCADQLELIDISETLTTWERILEYRLGSARPLGSLRSFLQQAPKGSYAKA